MPLGAAHTSGQIILAADINAIETAVNAKLDTTTASATFRPKNTPSHVGTRTNDFDPKRGTYNWKMGNTRKIRADIAKAAAGSALPQWACIGDSETSGSGATPPTAYPAVLNTLLAARGVSLAGSGLVNMNESGLSGARWTRTGSWNGGSLYYVWQAVGAAATFTADRAGTTMDLYYFNNSGTFTVAIDGGSAVTITPTGGATLGKYTVTGLSNAVHTVVVTSTSSSGYLIGVDLYGSSGLRVHNFGVAGAKASDWTTNAFGTNAQVSLAPGNPTAVVIELGVNEAVSGVALATFETNLTAVIALYKALATVPDVVLLTSFQPTQASTSLVTWQTYINSIYNVADAKDVPVLDVSELVGSAANATALGLSSGDAVPHPNASGYAFKARHLINALDIV